MFIPEDDRGTLCVSSQAGCAVGCRFCSTGHQGFSRNLSTAEIVGQLWFAEHRLRQRLQLPEGERAITNVVMMGMGEPLQNYAALVPALRVMLDDHGYGLSRRRVTVSTSGVVPMIDRLRDDCPVALAVSLHAPNDALRDELVPLNRKYPLAELLQACTRYLDAAPRDFITFEYCMLDGVNDTPEQARQLVRLVRGLDGDAPALRCKLNLIPFNPFPASGLQRSPPRARGGLCRGAAGCRHRDHRAQDPRRRHRRRLRPTGRRGAGPHAGARAHAPRADPHPWRRCARGRGDDAPCCRHGAAGAVCWPLRAGRLHQHRHPHRGQGRRQGGAGQRRTRESLQRSAGVRLELASLYFGRGQFDTALDEVKLALRPSPSYGAAYNLRGLIYAAWATWRWPTRASSGRCRSTRATATRCTTTAGSCASNKRYAEAEAQFQQALAQPKYRGAARTLLAQGVCQARDNRLADAEALADALLRDRPEQPDDGLHPGRGAVPPRRTTSARASTSTASTSRPSSRTRRRCGWARASNTSWAIDRWPSALGDQLRERYPAVARGAGLRTGPLR